MGSAKFYCNYQLASYHNLDKGVEGFLASYLRLLQGEQYSKVKAGLLQKKKMLHNIHIHSGL